MTGMTRDDLGLQGMTGTTRDDWDYLGLVA